MSLKIFLVEKYLKDFYLYKKIDFYKLNKYFKEDYNKRFSSKMQFYSGGDITERS